MKRSLLIIVILVQLAVLSSCKKQDSEPVVENNSITGMWTESQTNLLYRNFLFAGDGNFKQYLAIKTNNVIQAITISGTYTVSGNKIGVKVTEQITKNGNDAEVKTALNTTLFDLGTFTIKNNVMVINYTTYPADAPVPTTITLRRDLPVPL